MSKEEIPIKKVVQLEIACSFCSNKLRKDQNEDFYDQNEEYHFRRDAIQRHWSTWKTREGFVLTFCPDHLQLQKEMGS